MHPVQMGNRNLCLKTEELNDISSQQRLFSFQKFEVQLNSPSITPFLQGPSPPVIHIPRHVRQSESVNDAYSQALDEYGPVIVVVPRHNCNEYVIDHRYAPEDLTDIKNYTFGKAAFKFLHFGYLTLFDDGRFVHDIDSLIEGHVQPRMTAIIERLFPVFHSFFDNLSNELELSGLGDDKNAFEISDIFSRMQQAISLAMVVLILRPEHSSPKTANRFAAVAVAMARMTGMHENMDE